MATLEFIINEVKGTFIPAYLPNVSALIPVYIVIAGRIMSWPHLRWSLTKPKVFLRTYQMSALSYVYMLLLQAASRHGHTWGDY